MSKHYYASYDWSVVESNPSVGFANTKRAIAFNYKGKRDEFVEKRSQFDFSCKPITRKEAMQMLETVPMTMDKGLPLNIIDSIMFLVLRESRY